MTALFIFSCLQNAAVIPLRKLVQNGIIMIHGIFDVQETLPCVILKRPLVKSLCDLILNPVTTVLYLF